MINIHSTSKSLIDAVTNIMTEKKSVKEVEQPRAKGEKDFKDLHSYVIKEKLDPKADASVWIDDFVKSDAPQFDGKSKEERIQMALGAYYDARKEAGLEEDSIKLPEGVADFIGAASKAAADGKKEFEFGGKTYPVKISKKVADKVSKAMGESIELEEGGPFAKLAKKLGHINPETLGNVLKGKIKLSPEEKKEFDDFMDKARKMFASVESTELDEATFYKPKVNAESETITFVNDAEAKQAEKLFTSMKLKVQRSGKQISFINTAEFKSAKSKVMDESVELDEAISPRAEIISMQPNRYDKSQIVPTIMYAEKQIISAIKKLLSNDAAKKYSVYISGNSQLVDKKTGETITVMKPGQSLSDIADIVDEYIVKKYPAKSTATIIHPSDTRSIVTADDDMAKELKKKFQSRDTKVRIMSRKEGNKVYLDSKTAEAHAKVVDALDKMISESVELEEKWGPKNPQKVGTVKDNHGKKIDVEVDANDLVWLSSESHYLPSGWRLKDIQGKDTLYIDMGQKWTVTGLNAVLGDM